MQVAYFNRSTKLSYYYLIDRLGRLSKVEVIAEVSYIGPKMIKVGLILRQLIIRLLTTLAKLGIYLSYSLPIEAFRRTSLISLLVTLIILVLFKAPEGLQLIVTLQYRRNSLSLLFKKCCPLSQQIAQGVRYIVKKRRKYYITSSTLLVLITKGTAN